jgi:ectoine hydroxylase-related dioxygenase (phytanoyl-CoA dioxygenase family)
MKSEYDNNGYFLIEKAIDPDTVDLLISKLTVLDNEINNYGVRNLMTRVPFIRQLAVSSPLLSIAKEILGDHAKPVRSVFFDKIPGANWNVAWHQDTSIAVNTKADVPGFGPWTVKQGIVHVEPPPEYLASILTLRVHLDTANTETGVLRVIPGTHCDGRTPSQELLRIVEKSTVVECKANRGDVLLMSPLLYHSSRKAVAPDHRRIVHIEYSALELPEPLEWFVCVTFQG